MSGIEELKQKTKLSMDEMYEDKSVGKLEKQIAVHPENQLSNNMETQQDRNTSSQPDGQMEMSPPKRKTGKSETLLARKMESHLAVKIETPPVNSMQMQKTYNCKMTFNLTDEMYKAFNDLYAKRMLQGRKTEKSELICEAIQWLVQMEEDV